MYRWVVCWILAAGSLGAADVASAQAELRRVELLVEAGAAPKSALVAARRRLQDAQNEQFLRDTLYSGNVTPDQVPEMLRAATDLRARAAEALTAQEKLVAEGVQPAASLNHPRQDLAHAERQLELAQSRARLIEELAEMARREAELAEEADQRFAFFEGKRILTDRDFFSIETAFFDQFSKPLPVSARGSTAVHRSLGFDHRDRFDVALNPEQEEGRWLLRLLDRLQVPYIAFRRAVAGKATGAHIHIGLPSPRR
jgi:hypothetical protein